MRTRILCLFAVLALCSFAGSAQTSRGTVSGIITDPNGAVVGGATITLTSSDTSLSRTTTSNSEGFYRFDAVELGTYSTKFTGSGFGELTKTNVIVSAGQTSTVDAQLQLGGQQAVVNVTGEAGALLQTEAPVRGGNISQRQITELPVAGRNPVALALTLPGVTSNRGGLGVSTFIVNGARGRSNNFMIDGMENNDISVAGQAFQITNPDAIQEVNIQTGNYDAEFGRAGGGVINVITKAGSNEFHGSLSAFLDSTRDDAITSSQARNPAIARQVVQPANVIPRGYPPFGIQTTYAATLGGPLYLPRFGEGGRSLVDGRNRTFFFVGYQWERQRIGGQQNLTTPSPNGVAALRALFPAGTNANVDAYLAATQNVLAVSSFQQVALGLGGNTSAGSSTACPAPAGNRPCVEFGSFFKSFASIFDERQFQLRIDHRLGDNDQLSGRFLYDKQAQPFGGTANALPGFEADFSAKFYNFVLSETHVFSANLTNEMRVGYNRILLDFPLSDESIAANLPRITFNGLTLTSLGAEATFPQGRIANNYVVQDTLTRVMGNHTFRGGVDYLRQISRQAAPFNPRGNLTYTASTGYNSFGNFVDNFGGSNATASRDFGSAIYFPSLHRIAAFFQDRWKASPALTLTLGLRYENFGTPFNTLRTPAYTGLFNVDPVTLAGPFDDPNKVASDNNNFSPTFGFAWSPSYSEGFLGRLFGEQKTVLRGGYQMGYDSFFNNIASNAAVSSPNVISTTVTSLASVANPRGLSNFTSQFPTSARPTSPFDPQTLIAADLVNPYYQRWSFGMQRELAFNLIFDISYVGSKGTKLYVTEDANPLLNRPDLLLPVPAGFTGTPQSRLDRLQGGRSVRTNGASSIYHSGQLEVRRRFANNFTMTGGYTWSKLVSNADEVFGIGLGTTTAFYSLPAVFGGGAIDRAVSIFDRLHKANITWVYELPFHREQRGFVGHVVGGWQLSGVTTWESGVPFSVFNGLDSDGIGGGLERPSFNPAGQRGVRAVPVVDANNCILRYTNPDAGGATIDPSTAQFIVNPTFVPGASCSVPRFGSLGRDTLRTPGLNNWNINLQKNIRLGETTRIELRTEFFNVFNHPQFTQGSISPFSPLGGTINSNAATAPAGRFLNQDTVGTDGGGRVIRYQLKLIF
ncbi:MAG: carboxypeptidase regulatory-like domain-containing protein [Pyrinomonadaceae bacterium]